MSSINIIYQKFASRGNLPLFPEMGDVNPSEFPSIKTIVEQSDEEFCDGILRESSYMQDMIKHN